MMPPVRSDHARFTILAQLLYFGRAQDSWDCISQRSGSSGSGSDEESLFDMNDRSLGGLLFLPSSRNGKEDRVILKFHFIKEVSLTMHRLFLRVTQAFLPVWFVAATLAQRTVPITLSFNGTGADQVASLSGTISPYGSATAILTASGADFPIYISFAFRLSNGDMLTAAGSSTPTDTALAGTAKISGGTGVFANATGTFNFSVSGPDENVSLAGSGTVVTSAAPGSIPVLACDGGGGAGGAVLAYEGGGSCAVILCDGGGSTLPIGIRPPRAAAASGGSCEVLQIASNGVGGTLPVLVFDGADGGGGAGGAVLTFEGSGGTLPTLLFASNGSGGTLPVLLFATNGSGGTLPVGIRAASGSTGSLLEIATPLQAAAASYTAAAACSDGPLNCWITIPTVTGAIKAGSRAAITAVINPQGLNPGVYTANVAITITPGATLNVPVSIVITPPGPFLKLSQTGLRFQSVSGQAASPAQSISVSNSFTSVVTTLSGGNWLSVSPPSSATAARVSIQVSPAGLAPGTYSGRLDFSGPGIVNAPQSVEVSYTVLPSNATPGPSISTTGLIFVAAGSNPAPQTVQVSNPSSQPLTVSTRLAFAKGSNWFGATANGLTETVTVNATGLAPGTYVGTLDIHIAETNSDYPIEVLLVVKGATCTPRQLLPVFTNLEGGFRRMAGSPVPLQVAVVDDCGSPLTAGAVVAYFGGPDPAVSLISLGGGQWAGTWMPHALMGATASAGVMATGVTPALYGSAGVIGTLTANPNVPLVNAGGIVSAASLINTPIAPGSFLSIFGSNLAAGVTPATSLPLPTTLGGTRVLLGGKPLPLQVAATGQINAVVPYDVPVGATQQLIVERNGSYSLPETVVVAQAQPAVFTQNQSGKGAGVIVVAKVDGTQFLNTASQPAGAGDALVIYCTGLGAVTSDALPATANPVTVTIGSQSAQVFFAGPVSGFAGLYQVNVYVPAGVAGANVPVVLSVAGMSSPPVTLAIQ